MESSIIISLAVSGISAIISSLIWINARKGIRNQTYIKLLEEYSSPQMLIAVKTLADLRDRCKKEKIPIKKAYQAINKKDEIALKKAVPEQKRFIIEQSINNHRRLVSHFYYRLSAVLRNRVLPKRYIFRYWNFGGLSLIPDVLDKLHLDDDKELAKLYEQACEFRKRDTRQIAQSP